MAGLKKNLAELKLQKGLLSNLHNTEAENVRAQKQQEREAMENEFNNKLEGLEG